MILEPIGEADFSQRSYGFRPNRSTYDAISYLRTRLASHTASTYQWVNELPRSKLRGINPPLAYSHGPASLAGWMLVYLVYGLHANLSTTPTGRLGAVVAYRLFHEIMPGCPTACGGEEWHPC
jgi:hypothetical protein